MSPTQATASPNLISTNGWDTVYALYFPDVNKAIVAQKSSPLSFSYSKAEDDGTYTLTGTFGDWQLVAGGDGATIHMLVPVTTATLALSSKPATDGSPALAGQQTTYASPVQVTVEVKLAWVNAAQDDNNQVLIVNGTSAITEQPAVAILSVDYGNNPQPGMVEAAIFQQFLGMWLANHAGAFKHVFSSITLNASLDKNPGFQWTVPTATLYAVVDQGNDANGQNFARSIFAVLCMTEGRLSPGAHEVDPFAIPLGTEASPVNSAFLINPARIMGNMLLPGLPLLFRDNPLLSSFSVSPDGLSISNNEELQFADQQLDDGTTIHPKVRAQSFTIAMMGPLIQLQMNGLYFDYVSGTTVNINHTSTVSLKLNTLGQFKMDLTHSTNHANVSQSDGVYIGTIAATLGLALASAAVGGLLGGVAEPAAAVALNAEEAGIELAPIVVDEGVVGAEQGNVAGAEVMQEVGAQAEAAVGGGAPSRFNLFFTTNWSKALVMLTRAIVGSSVAIVNFAVKYAALHKAGEIPTLDAFGTQVMAPVVWPNLTTAAAGAPLADQLVSGTLNGAFQVGLNLKFNPAPVAGT